MEGQEPELRDQKSELPAVISGEGGKPTVREGAGAAVTAPEAAPILYDADKQQRIPFLIEYEGEQVEVAFVLDAQTDTALTDYDKLLDRRLFQADRQQTGERNAMESIDKSYEASVWLFRDRAVSAEGFGEPGETLPTDWKDGENSIITEQEMADVIDKAYLAAQVMPLPIAKPGKRLPLNRNKTAASVVRLKALFEGHELLLTHQMGQPNAEQIATFKSIQKERWLVQGTHLNQGEVRIPPKFQKLGAIYKQLAEGSTGYVGRVPLHHQALVVLDHLSREVEAARKN
jgi:hypothetical protein